MNDFDRLEVALFPIPDVIAFPGITLPLHVFEPRYRQLVHDCVRDERMIGVSHVSKTIHAPSRVQTPEQALKSNQATYKPKQVFSAGHCEIRDTTEDGRMLVAINMRQRLRLINEVQSLPYRIVSCEIIQDAPDALGHDALCELKRLITDKLLSLVEKDNRKLAQELTGPEWQELDPATASFRLYRYLRFDADVMQTLLETRSVSERLSLTWDIVRRA